MFKNLFSNQKITPQQNDIIATVLAEYRSSTFKNGLHPFIEHVEMHLKKQTIQVIVSLPFPCQSELNVIATELSNALEQNVEIIGKLTINAVRQHALTGVKNIIAVASGKGGVGKSTTSVNLAYALQQEGAKVGLLDADIYGPSLPTMLGVPDKQPTSSDGKIMQPIMVNGIAVMSIGFLVPDEDAAVWRGPMASKAFNQLLNETLWAKAEEPLDYLIIDMPPGTGDIQITLAQQIPVAAAVIVTTPQNVALADAIKGIAMFEKVQVPVLGVIENMSYHVCDNCGEHAHIFGEGGGQFVAEQYETPLLGALPLNTVIREDADHGICIVIENSTGEIAQQYRKIARNLAVECFLQLDNRSPMNATIIVE